MAHPHQVAKAPGQAQAHAQGCLVAKLLVATHAGGAHAAALPRVDDDVLAPFDSLHVWPDIDNFAHNFVTHGQWQFVASGFQRRQSSTAHLKPAGLYVQVGVADAAVRHPHGDFVAGDGLKNLLNRLQRAAPGLESPAVGALAIHGGVLVWVFCCCLITSAAGRNRLQSRGPLTG